MAVNNFDNTLKGNTVYVKDGRVDKALRKFKKKIQDSGLLQEMRDRKKKKKPTSVRKRKASAAKNRWQKKLASQVLPKKLY